MLCLLLLLLLVLIIRYYSIFGGRAFSMLGCGRQPALVNREIKSQIASIGSGAPLPKNAPPSMGGYGV
jgi:hypothetical protein